MSNKKRDYYIYNHNTPYIKTIGQFISDPDSIGVGLNIAQLLIYEDENGDSNLEKITNRYTPEQLDEFEDLLNKANDIKPNQDVVITTSKTETGDLPPTAVEEKASNPSENILAIREEELEYLLKDPSETGYLNYKPSAKNEAFLLKMYNDNARALFTKFLYEVETKTNYDVVIKETIRTIAQQKKYIESGDSASLSSYHLIGLAGDIKLVNRDFPFIQITKQSSNKEWINSGVIKIADRLKLNWGGRFKNVNRDPVHFDLKHFFRVKEKQYFRTQGIELSPQTQTTTEQSLDDNSTFFNLPFNIGTQLALPIDKLDRGVLSTETNQTIQAVDYNCFLAKYLIELLSDKGCKRVYEPKSGAQRGTVQEIFPHISVWVWSRALSISNIKPSESGVIQYDHKIINVTPYVKSVSTTVVENGGSFNLNLAPITSEIASDGWSLAESTQKSTYTKNSDYVNQGAVHFEGEDDTLKRNRIFFEKAIQANDLVFIKFEKLELEADRGNFDELETISINDLPNQIFDMIALVDDVDNTLEHAAADINITISGRDLIKLLIEDGIYFYPSQFTSKGIFSNTGAANSKLQRFGARGEYISRFQKANKNIDRSLKFIMNNLGTIDICPGDLFDGYANSLLNKNSSLTIDKRSRAFPISDIALNWEQENKNDDLRESIINKIQKIIRINEADVDNPEDILEIIKRFLSERIDNKEIVIENEKIKSWYIIENNIVVKNKIPDALMYTFVQPNRVWLDKKSRVLKSTMVTNRIEALYNKADKDKLKLSELNNFKKLVYKKEKITLNPNTNYLNFFSVDSMISEIDSYLKKTPPNIKGIFNINDVELLKLSYKGLKARGSNITLVTLTKLFNDLTTTEKDVFNDIYELIVNESGVTKIKDESQPPLLAGIWQIIKLIVDESVKDRRLTDPSIGNENGSMLNAFRKICQDPFCEFYTDTYGSQFYFIARKKPFDFASIKSVLEGRAVYEKLDYLNNSGAIIDVDKFGSLPPDVDSLSVKTQSLIVDIEESDVISDSLKYSTEAYSWYRLQLNNLTSGSESDIAWAYLPGIFFEEYADIYGSKPLDLTTSYIPFSPIEDKDQSVSTAYFIKQGIYDLKYMIESHAHLPFTRMGTLVLNGDRRIKRGNFVRLKSTNEIFYVDSVINSFSIGDKDIDRTTVLHVSRGMVEQFIKGVDFYVGENNVLSKPSLDYGTIDIPGKKQKPSGDKINISYFNICDLTIDSSIFNSTNGAYADYNKGSVSNWKVNKIVFNFFLKKLQFAKNLKEINNAGINLFER